MPQNNNNKKKQNLRNDLMRLFESVRAHSHERTKSMQENENNKWLCNKSIKIKQRKKQGERGKRCQQWQRVENKNKVEAEILLFSLLLSFQ